MASATDLPRCTILFDNRPGVVENATLWGFSCLLEAGGARVLFDTGSNGRALLRNMELLGVAGPVDMVFLSHPHWDHTGGLDSVLEGSPDATVVVHRRFSAHQIADVREVGLEVVVIGDEPQALGRGLHSTGLLGETPGEHALVVELGTTTALLSGCAHPGIERVVARASSALGKPIEWVIGGLHLLDLDAEKIARVIQRLEVLGVRHVVPTHCTGDAAVAAFEAALGERCIPGGVGRVLTLRP